MADLGVDENRLPVAIKTPEETKTMKLMWIEGRIHETHKQICNFKRQLEGAELTLQSQQEAKKMLINSVTAKEVR